MKVAERIRAVCSCFCKRAPFELILPFVVLLLLLIIGKSAKERTRAPISGSERPDSQANSARKAGWLFLIV
jgi:hypothetical protein